jgi:anti-sigma factor RsiW
MESMSNDPLEPEAGLREELVAYLDGELDSEQSRRIEQRAAVEPDTRRMLEELDRTWHILDELDIPPTGDDFTRTTLEMVAVAAVQDAEKTKAEAPRRRLKTRLLIGGGLMAAAAAGFFVVASLTPDPDADLLKDLPILENLDQYREVYSIEVLRELNKQKLFTEDADDGR